MSIMSFRRSRLIRAAAAFTLTSLIAGCLPQNVKDGSNTLLSSASGVSDGAGNLLASIGNTSNSIADFTGVQMPGASTGNELRGWDDNDQKAAEEAYKVFAGKPLDSLPVYDPLKPGELQRYKAKLNELVTKYKGRETLNKDEMMEFSETVVPLVRFLAKSRAYRASAQKVPNITRDPRGQASVVVPAGMTMEIALLTYCNDHGLPAPWKGEKLSMRSSAPYMPQALRPLYADLHQYAATNPSAHYQMQSTVWWLRGGTCNFDALNQQQKGFIEASHPGGMNELQNYCTQKKLKGKLFDSVASRIPGAGASSKLADYQQLLQAANDYNTKAQAFLSADLTNPTDLLRLAETSGLQASVGSKGLFSDPTLRQVLPLLQKSGLATALTPKSLDDKAVATSLSVMEELGRQLGEQQGGDNGSLANYSRLPNGLYVDAMTQGGASHAYIRVRNTGTTDLELNGNDFVLTSVDDKKAGHPKFRPTQRLSIGPLQPAKIYPNDDGASKRNTPKNESDAVDALSVLKNEKFTLQNTDDAEAEKQCAQREKESPGSGTMTYGDLGLGVIRDVVQAIPFVGTAVYAYSAVTGKDWLTGADLSVADRAVAVISAVIPAAAIFRGVRVANAVGKTFMGTWKQVLPKMGAGYDESGKVVSRMATGIKGAESVIELAGGDGCSAWAAGAGAVANYQCISVSKKSCVVYNGVMSAIGSGAQLDLQSSLTPKDGWKTPPIWEFGKSLFNRL